MAGASRADTHQGGAEAASLESAYPRTRHLIMSRLPSHAVQGELKPLANVRNIIAVGSGKGGVDSNACLSVRHFPRDRKT